jgi:hypothetical protein
MYAQSQVRLFKYSQTTLGINTNSQRNLQQAEELWDQAKRGRPFTDVTFSFPSGIPSQRAHKSVLSARSEVFRNKLLDHSGDEFPVYGVRRETFSAFLEFLYTGACTGDGVDGGELYDLGSAYGVSRLLELLRGSVDESNVAAAAQYAVKVCFCMCWCPLYVCVFIDSCDECSLVFSHDILVCIH